MVLTIAPGPDTTAATVGAHSATMRSASAWGITTTRPIVVVANRLPGSFDPAGRWVRSPGGLVSAMLSALDGEKATWIGAHVGDTEAPMSESDGLIVNAVSVTDDEHAAFCDGFANSTLWPLYHDAIRPAIYDESLWRAYVNLNRKFAETTAESAPDAALVWIHDYHLQLVPRFLRNLRPDVRIGYFHHIPFPNADLFRQLPWRDEIIHGLAGADLLGFQRSGDVENFLTAANTLCDIPVSIGMQQGTLIDNHRRVNVGVFAVPVDSDAFAQRAKDPIVRARAAEICEVCGRPERLLLGVDRLDYTKGIDQRLGVLRGLLAKGVLKPGRDAYLQLAIPSRPDANGYAELRARVEQLVGDINGEYAEIGQPIVHYLHRSVDVNELTAMYRAADVMLVTPFRDGMNLVAKEYVASRVDATGSLVLSEFAGAADELHDANLVNPYDVRSMEHAIGRSLLAPDRAAMRAMRRRISEQSPAGWASQFLQRLENGW